MSMDVRTDQRQNQTLSPRLQRAVRLVYMDADAHRPVQSARARPGDEVSFADGHPLMLITQSALDALNARLAKPVSMLQFRPNLVVDGVDAGRDLAQVLRVFDSRKFTIVE